jgi:hypothetical protein
MDRSEEESRGEKRSEERSIPSFAVEHPASDPVIVNRVAIADIAVPEVILAETIAAEPVPAAAIPEQSTSTDTAPKPRADKAVRGRKPPLRVYNYALECLLIGVSAWVLVKTQRSTLRYSSPSASRDRVA